VGRWKIAEEAVDGFFAVADVIELEGPVVGSGLIVGFSDLSAWIVVPCPFQSS
jgi:hypothetical protein